MNTNSVEGKLLSRALSIFFLVLLGGFWLLLTLPSVFLSDWFPLDMPTLFEAGDQLLNSFVWMLSPYNGSGRYFPLYWLYWSVQRIVFGGVLWPYFLTQSLIFLISTLLTCRLIWRITGVPWASAILFIAIFLGTPIPENLTTLGKGEPLSYFFAIATLSIVFECVRRGRMGWGNFIACGVLFAFGIWTKETSLVLLGFSVVGFLSVYFLSQFEFLSAEREVARRVYAQFFCALLVGICLAKTPYVLFTPTTSGSVYTAYDITLKLLLENLYFYIAQQPDVLFFGMISLWFLIKIAKYIVLKKSVIGLQQDTDIFFVVGLFAMGCGYYLALLIWRWPMNYYMLLPSIAFKFCALYGFLVARKYRLFSPFAIKGMLISAIIFVIYASIAVFYVGSTQIAYSRVYSEAIKRYQSLTTAEHPLIIESYPFYAEQVYGTYQLLASEAKEKRIVKGIADLLDPQVTNNPDLLNLLGVTPASLEANYQNLPKTGDYLLSITGSKLATWFLRGVTPYYNDESFLKKQGMYEMELVAENSISAPALFPHVWTLRPAWEMSYIGYKLYRVLEDQPKFLWRGRYPDGWVGNRSSIQFSPTYSKPIAFKLSVPAFALPNTIIISVNGQVATRLSVLDANEIAWAPNDTFGKNLLIEFAVEKSESPRSGFLLRDTRKLGARIALD